MRFASKEWLAAVVEALNRQPALPQAVGRRSRVPVEVLQPLERVAIEAKEVNTQLLQSRAAQFSVALGLAMRKDRERRL